MPPSGLVPAREIERSSPPVADTCTLLQVPNNVNNNRTCRLAHSSLMFNLFTLIDCSFEISRQWVVILLEILLPSITREGEKIILLRLSA